MKRKVIMRVLALAMTVTMIAGMTGCKKMATALIDALVESSEEVMVREMDSDNFSEEDSEKKSVDVEKLVVDMYNISGALKMTYADSYSEEKTYSYKIPKIDAETEGAKKINQELENMYGAAVAFYQQGEKIGSIDTEGMEDYKVWVDVGYNTYINDSIISILVEEVPYYEEGENYYVYNYDANSGKWLTDEELIATKGLSPEEWKTMVRKEIAYEQDAVISNFFEYNYSDWDESNEYGYPQNMFDVYSDMLDCRYEALSEQNRYDIYSNDKSNSTLYGAFPVYLDEAGDLGAVLRICVPAGGGSYNKTVTVGKHAKQQPLHGEFSNEGGRYEVDCNEEGIILTVNGKKYNVEGGMKNYTKVEFYDVMGGVATIPFVLFLCDDGTVSYINIDATLNSGVYYVTEPLWNCVNQTDFTDAHEPLYEYSYIFGQEFGISLMGLYNESGYDADEGSSGYSFTVSDGKVYFQTYSNVNDTFMAYESSIQLISMTEEGKILKMYLYDETEDAYYSGIFSWTQNEGFNEELQDYVDSATIHWITIPEGVQIRNKDFELQKSYG